MPFPKQPVSKFDKDKIKKLRVQKRLTYLQLGDALNTTYFTIFQTENKMSHIPSAELMIRYCQYFKIPFMELLKAEEKKIMGKQLADFLLKEEVIDHGTANSIINYYSN